MASSPELMQAAARYNIGGLVNRTDIDPSEILKGVTPMPMIQPNRITSPLDQNLGGGNPLPLGMFQARKNTTQHLEDIGNSVGGIQEDVRRAGINMNTASGNLDTARSMLGIEEPSGINQLTTTTGLAEGGPVQGYAEGKYVNAGFPATVDENPPTFMGDVLPFAGGVLKDVVTGIPGMARKAVDITQSPTEFKETVTETVKEPPSDGNLPTVSGFTAEGVDQEVKKFVDEDAIKQAEKTGEAVISGDVTPENVPPELEDALKKVQNPDASNPEKTNAILGAAGVEVPKGTKGKIAAMKKLISEAYGVDPARYDNLRSLNRAMVGFAIAEGGDIATALKQGAAGAAKIEETQLAREDAITEAAVGQTFAERNAALKAAAKAPKTFLDTPEGEAAVKIYQDYLKSNLSEADARAKVNEISPGLGDRVAAAIAGGVPSTTTKATEGVDVTQTAGSDVRVQTREGADGKTYRVYSDGRPPELVE
jgi:hypothetical protein